MKVDFMLNAQEELSDKIIRHILIENICKTYDKSKLRIIEELNINDKNTRVDIAVINGIFHGYEIKSDLDNLERLPKQIKDYNKVFDKMTLVVGKKHLLKSFNLVPDHWGVTVVKKSKNGFVLNEIRKPTINKLQDKMVISNLLWKNEALSILDDLGEVRGFRSKRKELINEHLSGLLDLKTLKSKVRFIFLNSRKDWRSGSAPVLYAD